MAISVVHIIVYNRNVYIQRDKKASEKKEEED
jgi:hypothetical protein